MEYFVSSREKKILESIKDEYRSYHEISKVTGLNSNGVVSTLKHLLKMDYIIRERLKFKSRSHQFVEASNAKIEQQRYNMINHIEPIEEIIYKPSDEEKVTVARLLSQKIRRSEIAKQLNMKPINLTWTIIEIEKNQKMDEREGNFLFVDRLTFSVYKLIEQSDYTTLQIANQLGEDAGEVRERIMNLIKLEAIRTNHTYNKVTYIPLNKILKLNSYKKKGK